MIELILARHGESHGNLDRSLGPDTQLTDLGREQAGRLGVWLAGQGYAFTAFYCSPLLRARQTADIVNTHFGLPIVFDPDLREGELTFIRGMPIRSAPLGPDPQASLGPGYQGFCDQVGRVASRILEEDPEGRVLVISHAGTLGTMVRLILGIHTLVVSIDHAAVHSLRWADGRWWLRYLNRQEHLVG